MIRKHFIAFDLGATSGRTLLGSLENEHLSLKELTRFPNKMLELNGHLYWNIFSLYEHLKDGFAAAVKEGVKITSVGIDTWGVDFAFVGEDGSLIGLPYAYRDPHTLNAPNEYFANILPREEVYRLTGIQVMNFNSLFQLYTMQKNRSSQLTASHRLLFMPDALSYMLTGNMVTEYTIASTSQLLNPLTKKIEEKLLASMGLDLSLFCQVVMPGHTIGWLSESITKDTGIERIPVIAVAGHDTASAVAAIPATDEYFAYLSSGTWSLMGIEVKEPIITERTAALNITNEGGVEGTTRLLKNITGMWLAERCLAEWKKEGQDYTYPEMVALAEASPAFGAFIDPDDPSFANPSNMATAIHDFCLRTGQRPPQNHGETIRCIFESLALKYRKILGLFRELAPFPIKKLHVIGGGSKNRLLNRFTADAIGIPVIAGPSEATAIGNIMIQARTAGMADSLQQMRNIIAKAVDTETYQPEHTRPWDDAYERFIKILN